MGQKGEPFTDADLYMAAKHAAKYSAWADMNAKDRWEPFAGKVRGLPIRYHRLGQTSCILVYATVIEVMGGVLSKKRRWYVPYHLRSIASCNARLAIMKLRKKIRKEMDKEVLPERCARPSRPLGKSKYSKSDSEESESDDQQRPTASKDT